LPYINWKIGEQHLAPIQVKRFSSKSTSINKVGIIITILGVVIGVKYATVVFSG
jgi:hypothetical protein